MGAVRLRHLQYSLWRVIHAVGIAAAMNVNINKARENGSLGPHRFRVFGAGAIERRNAAIAYQHTALLLNTIRQHYPAGQPNILHYMPTPFSVRAALPMPCMALYAHAFASSLEAHLYERGAPRYKAKEITTPGQWKLSPQNARRDGSSADWLAHMLLLHPSAPGVQCHAAIPGSGQYTPFLRPEWVSCQQ